jgi:hypothetical protein
VQDYFFALRDYDSRVLDAAANGPGGWNPARVLRNDSTLASDGAPPAPGRAHGWRVALGRGESVDGTARTFGGALLFTTTAGVAPAGCAAARRLYVLDARSGGTPAGRESRSIVLPPSPRALPIVFAFPPRSREATTGCAPGAVGCANAAACFVGLTGCGPLPPLAPIRTVWSELETPR